MFISWMTVNPVSSPLQCEMRCFLTSRFGFRNTLLLSSPGLLSTSVLRSSDTSGGLYSSSPVTAHRSLYLALKGCQRVLFNSQRMLESKRERKRLERGVYVQKAPFSRTIGPIRSSQARVGILHGLRIIAYSRYHGLEEGGLVQIAPTLNINSLCYNEK